MHKDWLGKAKDKEEPRKGEHMQLGLNYRGGPLSVDERPAVAEGVTRAGDRAPDARLDGCGGRAGPAVRCCSAGRTSRCWRFGDAELPALDPQACRTPCGPIASCGRAGAARRRRADRRRRRRRIASTATG